MIVVTAPSAAADAVLLLCHALACPDPPPLRGMPFAPSWQRSSVGMHLRQLISPGDPLVCAGAASELSGFVPQCTRWGGAIASDSARDSG